MRISRLTLLALAGLLVSAGSMTVLGQAVPGDVTDLYTCGAGPGAECQADKLERCTRWTIVELKIGTNTVVSRECSEKTTYTKYSYWTQA